MDPIEGVDYAWNGPSPAALKAAGKRFACRYGGPGSDGKQLHADELRALRAAGIDIVANAEGGAGDFRTRSVGRSWATSALAHFNALGMPAGRPIYFSADWDVQTSELDDVDAALHGAADVLGAERVGLYGGLRVIEHARNAGSARWLWQTYGWSKRDGSIRWADGVHIQQYRNGVTIGGGDCDLNRAHTADYGQWGYQEEDMPLTDTDKAWIKAELAKLPKATADAAGSHQITSPDGAGVWSSDGYARNAYVEAKNGRLQADKAVALANQLLTLAQGEAAEIVPTADENARALVAALGRPEVDQAHLVSLLREILGPERAAQLGALLASA